MEAIGKALATIESVDEDYGPHGGFTAVLSTPSQDRDGDSLLRDEWKEFTQERYPLDMDHGMKVVDTIGSFVPYFDNDRLMMRAAFAPTDKAQDVRKLVTPDEAGIRHISNVSVAFMTDKSKKSGEPRRELLNAGVVAIPSNRDAKILDSKALHDRAEEIAREREIEEKAPKPYGNVHYADPQDGKYPIDTVAHIRAALAYINMPKNYEKLGDHAAHVKRAIEAAARAHGIKVAEKSFSAETESVGTIYVDVVPRIKAPGGNGDGPALTQAIHDASSHLGAICYPLVGPGDPTGADDGANKSADEKNVETDDKDYDPQDPATYEVVHTEDIPDDSPLGQWLGRFEKHLTEILIGEKSPAETPAEAAAASDEEPAPADDAAVKAADDVTRQAEILRMQMSLI